MGAGITLPVVQFVIPAQAGIQFVIPAQAGIQLSCGKPWRQATASVSARTGFRLRGNDDRLHLNAESLHSPDRGCSTFTPFL
jgi:hypothetical protein